MDCNDAYPQMYGYRKEEIIGKLKLLSSITWHGINNQLTIQETGEPGEGARFEITIPNWKWRF